MKPKNLTIWLSASLVILLFTTIACSNIGNPTKLDSSLTPSTNNPSKSLGTQQSDVQPTKLEETTNSSSTSTSTPNSESSNQPWIAVQVAAGSSSTCALTDKGGVKCWGAIYSEKKNIPTDVKGLQSGVVAIYSNDINTQCAVLSSGEVKCWGNIFSEQAAPKISYDPVTVPGLETGVASISISNDHGCAVFTDGSVKCWGANKTMQLGNGEQSLYEFPPVKVTVLQEPAVAVFAGTGNSYGGGHSCALTKSKKIVCWGNSSPAGESQKPITIENISGEILGFAKGVDCVTITGGGVKCWDANSFKIIDPTGFFPSSEAAKVDLALWTKANDVIHAEHGTGFWCGITTKSSVICSGFYREGQLGAKYSDPGLLVSPEPQEVIDLTSAVKFLSVGTGHSCAVLNDGTVMCWGGNNENGELGNGSFIQKDKMDKVIFPEPVRVVGSGGKP